MKSAQVLIAEAERAGGGELLLDLQTGLLRVGVLNMRDPWWSSWALHRRAERRRLPERAGRLRPWARRCS